MNADLENSLWFTGSTIAQTLSGSMGLLGAIMLFALQEAARSISRAAQQLSEIPHPSMNAHYIRHLLTRRSFHELARLYGQQFEPQNSGETSVELLALYSTLTWELEHDRVLRRSFWKALMASGVVIAISIACCGLAPQLSAKASIGQTTILLLIAGAVGCLILYGFLLRVIFRGSAEEVKVGAP
jgi:hypothetical protein